MQEESLSNLMINMNGSTLKKSDPAKFANKQFLSMLLTLQHFLASYDNFHLFILVS